MMSELSYKELQEQGVFDVPYRAFEFMQEQQAKIDELNEVVNGWKDEYRIMTLRYERSKGRIDEVLEYLKNLSWASELDVENVTNILKGNKNEKTIRIEQR